MTWWTDLQPCLIDTWLATRGRSAGSLDAVERLCYTGRRGMSALEFEPAVAPLGRGAKRIDVDALVRLAGEILSQRQGLSGSFVSDHRREALLDILRVGTSAGGARAKAVIAWNPDTREVRSGQVGVGEGFTHWLLKFDGVAGNRDKELESIVGRRARRSTCSPSAACATTISTRPAPRPTSRPCRP